MKEITYTITDPEGIHARPAGVLVKEAAKFTSKVIIAKDGQENLRPYGTWCKMWTGNRFKDRGRG